MDDIVSFGYWVRRRRKAMDLTQVALAQRVGCAVVTIKKIERDERRPSREMADLLADNLAIPDGERDTFVRMARGTPSSAWPAANSSPRWLLRWMTLRPCPS
jgi:transcriptional regulator with XRE-family HTH domain